MRFSKYSFSPAAKKLFRDQVPVISKKEAEMRENMMMLGGIAIGLGIGVVVGAAVTALTVPQSGAETRQDIRDKKDFAISGVKETSAKVAEKVKGAPCCGIVGKVKERIKGGDKEDVVVEYTIHYDDDETTIEKSVEESTGEDTEKNAEFRGCCEDESTSAAEDKTKE